MGVGALKPSHLLPTIEADVGVVVAVEEGKAVVVAVVVVEDVGVVMKKMMDLMKTTNLAVVALELVVLI
jgi:hypothetical protein